MTETLPGGYNGGGSITPLNSAVYAGSAGGATSIASASGLLKDLSGNRDSVVVVAGGGGGAWGYYLGLGWNGVGGSGGGFHGNGSNSQTNHGYDTKAGNATQDDGYAFGQGETNDEQSGASIRSAGGGGWFGGSIGQQYGGGNGGSGYIGGLIAGTRHMTSLAEGVASDEEATKTKIVPITSFSEEAQDDILKKGNGYAKANYHPYKVTYILDTEEWEYYITDTNQTVERKNIPRTGYVLKWYLNNDEYDFSTPITEDIVLTGEYTLITYNLTYDLGTGTLTEANPSTYTIESEDITLNNPTAPDYYDFLGWSGTDLDGDENLNVTIPKGSFGDREYTANIKPTKYNISYELNGGSSNTGYPATYDYETPEITLANPVKEGHTFLGWSGTDLDGSENFDVVIPAQSHGNREYEAHWSINQYTATFDVNGGSEINSTTKTSDYGVAFGSLPETHIDGYKFLGWFTEQDGGEQISATTTMPAEDHTFYAHWELITYTITYVLDGHTNDSSNPTSFNVHSDEIVIADAEPKAYYYYFLGWTTNPNTEEDLTKDFTIPSGSTEDITLYAIFQQNPYTIEFDCEDYCEFEPITKIGEEPIGELPTPERDGYIFLGWFIDDNKLEPTSTPRSSATAVARWEKIETPNTLDGIIKYVCVFAGCVLLLAIILVVKKKSKKNE